MAFDSLSVAENLTAWDSHGTFVFSVAHWAAKIARLIGPDLEIHDGFVVSLHRSAGDYVTNSRGGSDAAAPHISYRAGTSM